MTRTNTSTDIPKSGAKIAVVGGGIAGIAASYLLQEKYDVTLFEAADYLGGHTNTVIIPSGPDRGTPVDTGFIVLNNRTYPHLHRFLAELEVTVRFSDMSFGYYDEESGLQYAGTGFAGLFAQPNNFFSPSFWRLLKDVRRFARHAVKFLKEPGPEMTLREFLVQGRYSGEFIDHYLLPIGGAIWSTPAQGMLDFPAETFLHFFDNHGLVNLTDRPRWQTVVGGSFRYVQEFLKTFRGTVHLDTPIARIVRHSAGVEVQRSGNNTEQFAAVVLATHADTSLALLQDADSEERRLLGAWSYTDNLTVLHTDVSVLPPRRRAWASWNYRRNSDAHQGRELFMTYDLTRLQGLETHERYLVTLNPPQPIAEDRIVTSILYTHPTYTLDALRSQRDLRQRNGSRSTWFCGSYLGYGFHEDAVASACRVAHAFGIRHPLTSGVP